jgi:hypothetical protein
MQEGGSNLQGSQRKLSQVTRDEKSQVQEAMKKFFNDLKTPGGKGVSEGALVQFAEQNGWINTNLAATEVSLIFASVKLGRKKEINMFCFTEAVRKMAIKLEVTYMELILGALKGFDPKRVTHDSMISNAIASGGTSQPAVAPAAPKSAAAAASQPKVLFKAERRPSVKHPVGVEMVAPAPVAKSSEANNTETAEPENIIDAKAVEEFMELKQKMEELTARLMRGDMSAEKEYETCGAKYAEHPLKSMNAAQLDQLASGQVIQDGSGMLRRASSASETPAIKLQRRFTHVGNKAVDLNDFDIQRVLGTGSYGKVQLVRRKDNGKLFAMKSLKKEALKRMRQLKHTQVMQEHIVYSTHVEQGRP